jgi:hypothetical protein
VSLQGRDRYRGAVAGSTINAMSTSTTSNQTYDTATSTALTTATGFRRRVQ